MTLQQASQYLRDKLRALYDEGETAAITDWVMEHLAGSSKQEWTKWKEQEMRAEQKDRLEQVLSRLLAHEPLQYVLHEAWFCGMRFYVDEHVLIPRPETEELVEWIIAHCKFPIGTLRILDIGSGSGCIPIALKRRIRKAEVWSCDSSEAALAVARRNATALGAEVRFLHLDFLNRDEWERLPGFDLVVSNPPYIPENEKTQLAPNVRDYEPPAALFVPGTDPLLFYRAIAAFGLVKLNPGGAIFVEIHKDMGEASLQLFREKGYRAEIKKDMQGSDRMIRATR